MSRSYHRNSASFWIVPVAGALLGVSAAVGNQYPAVGWVVNAGGIWLLFAFLIGWLMLQPARAVIAGLGTLLIAVCTYYAVLLLVFEHRTAPSALVRAGLIWSMIALFAGSVGGLAGSLARHTNPVFAVGSAGIVSGIIAGEALWGVSQVWRFIDQLIYGLLFVVSAVVPWYVLRHPRLVGMAYGVVAITAFAVAATIPIASSIGRGVGI